MKGFIYKYILSDVGKVIWEALDTPDDWDFVRSEFTITHKETGICFWVSNGGFFFDGHENVIRQPTPPVPEIGLIERHFLYHKANSKKKKAKSKKISKSNEAVISLLKNLK